MTDLLHIPAFLRVGHPDREKAIEASKARFENTPVVRPAPPQFGLNFIKEKKVHTGQRGSKAKVTQTTRDANDIVRDQLHQLGYSKEFITTVGIDKARGIIKGILNGEGATREDQA